MPKRRQALIGEVGNAMQAYQRSVEAFDDTVGKRLGLNPTDLRCLDWLFDGAKSAGELSEATGLSSAATTTMIDRLEVKGLIGRVRDVADRRKVLVAMTPRGRERTGQLYGPMVIEGNKILARFSDDELALLRDFLVATRELTDRHRARLRK